MKAFRPMFMFVFSMFMMRTYDGETDNLTIAL